MSAYTSLAALKKRVNEQRLAEMADDNNPTADITDATVIANINQAIADGSSLIDFVLNGQIDMTDGSNSSAVEPIAAQLALYYLYQRANPGRDNPYEFQFYESMKTLRELAKGTMKTQTDVRSRAMQITYTSDRERIFGRNTDTDDPLADL